MWRSTLNRSGFTLIELLAVMAIMGLMMGLSIAAFTSLGKGSGIRSSTMMFKSGASLARQNAITKRARTTIIYGNMGVVPRGYYLVSNAVEGILGYTNWLSDGIVFYEGSEEVPLYGRSETAYDEPLVFKTDGTMDNGLNDEYIGIKESKPGTNLLYAVLRIQPNTGRVTEYKR